MPNAEPLFVFLYQFGSLWAVGLIGVAALVARRWRLAATLPLTLGNGSSGACSV
jgi:hypothetical protein